MKFNKTDLAHSRNMLKVLGKGEWKLDGMEILAMSDMMKWFSQLQRTIEMEIVQEEANEKSKAAEAEKLKAGKIEPKVVEDIIKPIDTVSKKISKKKD